MRELAQPLLRQFRNLKSLLLWLSLVLLESDVKVLSSEMAVHMSSGNKHRA